MNKLALTQGKRMAHRFNGVFILLNLLLSVKFVFILSFLMTMAGCTTEYNLATQKQETLIYSTDKEVQIGDAVAPKIEAEFKLLTDIDVNERVQGILDRIVAVCDRKDIVYVVKIFDDETLNAVSLPGGYVYVFRGILDKVESDDQLAGVIAHEVGHITARHGVKRMQSAYAALALQVAAASGGAQAAAGANVALTSLFLEYSQQAEFEADKLGVKYLKKAGYDPRAMAGFLEVMQSAKEKEPPNPFSYWKTHPNLSQRISVANQEVTGQLEFKDYLNMPAENY
jgi:predicted Zn-dependent protease